MCSLLPPSVDQAAVFQAMLLDLNTRLATADAENSTLRDIINTTAEVHEAANNAAAAAAAAEIAAQEAREVMNTYIICVIHSLCVMRLF